MNLKMHQAALEKWKKRPLHATETFVFDGPIDPDRWLKIERRVLFLAKEAYRGDGSSESWNLPELVREEWQARVQELSAALFDRISFAGEDPDAETRLMNGSASERRQ